MALNNGGQILVWHVDNSAGVSLVQNGRDCFQIELTALKFGCLPKELECSCPSYRFAPSLSKFVELCKLFLMSKAFFFGELGIENGLSFALIRQQVLVARRKKWAKLRSVKTFRRVVDQIFSSAAISCGKSYGNSCQNYHENCKDEDHIAFNQNIRIPPRKVLNFATGQKYNSRPACRNVSQASTD